MHDFLPISGVHAGANPDAVRRASDRRARRWHPELNRDAAPHAAVGPATQDAALDFVDMGAVVDRIHAAFFDARR